MKFKDFQYQRIDFNNYKNEYQSYLDKLEKTNDIHQFEVIFYQLNKLRNDLYTNFNIASIRHTIDTSDKFYDDENNYWDEYLPMFRSLDVKLYQLCLDSKLPLEQILPKTFLQLGSNAIKSFDEKIIPLMQKENNLTSQYSKLISSAKIEFQGETHNLSGLSKFKLNPDRNIRKQVLQAQWTWFEQNEEQIDEIYDQLVQVRTQMAKELGYNNYQELGYVIMNRLDYNKDDIEILHNEIIKQVVPNIKFIDEQHAKRINVDKVKAYDASYLFTQGNLEVKEDSETLLKYAQQMYSEMSKETKEFFDVMVQQELFDLETKPNKAMGGYCSDLANYKVPFIFSNFNHTSGDVDVLTHEAGHALQCYETFKHTTDIVECAFPTYESAEIHSMSMEFLAYPWMHLFFKEDVNKYFYKHLSGCLTFLPYGTLVDHFQHEVYQHPELTKEERKQTWRNLQKQYQPELDFDDIDMLNKGCYWYQQSHIFCSPFYYIDYVLAQICALQFYIRTLKNDPQTFNDYLTICRLGGTKSFLQLVEAAHLQSPFKEGTLKEIVELSIKELNKINID
ncbi:MAG: M3 family oligoendopeptidase [Erysipelotrichaceae bacterium]